MAEPELFAVMDQAIGAWAAVDDAWQQAQAAGQIEQAITLNLVLRSVGDGVLALDELLEAEGTRGRDPRPVAPGVGCGWSRDG